MIVVIPLMRLIPLVTLTIKPWELGLAGVIRSLSDMSDAEKKPRASYVDKKFTMQFDIASVNANGRSKGDLLFKI